MRILFDPDFDSGFWPGPLGTNPSATASVGEAWVGPRFLMGILETALGLGGLFPSQSERTISLAKNIRDQEGFWSRSAEKDPIGVARTLLRWIDWLKIHGWNGQSPPSAAKTPRLTDLAKIEPSALPGTSDRLSAIMTTLDKRRPDIESIETFEPRDRLLPLWQRIFDKLASRGVSIEDSPIPPAPSSSYPGSNLRRALSPRFSPSRDGSLILFRPPNPLDAAEEVAAWLCSLGDLSGTLVISADVALDESLRRFGLPATGARESTNDDPFLQILPLVLAMGWNPPDPQRALELLLLPDGPIPGFIARDLRYALQQWPAVGSLDWKNALATGLDEVSDSVRRSLLRERLDSIFRPAADIHSPYPASALKLRAQTVKKWVAARRYASSPNVEPNPAPKTTPGLDPSSLARASVPSTDFAERMDEVIAQCATLEKLIDLSGLDSFTETQLLKLNIEIADSVRSRRRYIPQAGIASVSSPSALAGPARRVIWWNFTLESTPEPFSIPFSCAERSALSSIRVDLTPAAELAADHARRRRRPFECASETLLLVCPQFGEDGDERHHHPLWDEVVANKDENAKLSLLEQKHLLPIRSLPTRIDPLLPIPSPRRSWTVAPAIIDPPAQHSPTSLQTLIGCPFKWALSYLGSLKEPEIAALTDNDKLMGNLSHKILEDVLCSAPLDGASANAHAFRLFDEIGPTLAAPLFLPGAPIQLAFARKATADAARDLVNILKEAALPVAHVEFWASKKTDKIELNGRIDLVAGDPPVIIDLKWGSESFHRDKLKAGTATQLAAYSFMLKNAEEFPPVAFFIIRNQRLIAQKGAPFNKIETVDGPPIQDTWDAFLSATRSRLDAIKQGRIEALAVPLSDETGVVKKDKLSDDRIELEPPCKFCSFGYLCGLDWENA